MSQWPAQDEKRVRVCRRRLVGLLVWDTLLGTAAILLGLAKVLEHHQLLPLNMDWLTARSRLVRIAFAFFVFHAIGMHFVFNSCVLRIRCSHKVFTFKGWIQFISFLFLFFIFEWIGVRPQAAAFLLGAGSAYVFFSARYVRDVLEADPAELVVE